MVAWTRVVVVEMERRIPQVPPALLMPIFSLNPVTRVCSRICLSTLRGSAGVSSSRKPSPDNASPPRSFRSCVYLLHCPFSHLILLYGLAVLRSVSGDAFISLVLLSPAVRLENLWLDDLITGTAHYEIEVVMCWIMAK